MENKTNYKINITIALFIIASILFATPSIIYFLQKQTILNFGPYFQFLYNFPISRATQTIIYIFLLTILSVTYFKIIKQKKENFILIAVVSIIFIFVLPFTSSDIFYYLGIGRIDSTYSQNPYYTTVKQFVEQGENKQYLQNDTILAQAYQNDWADTTVIYGPIWTIVCKIIAGISLGNINIGLFIFKIVNTLVHLCNCYLIYKITNKKIFTMLYGLNPYILIEGIACVHNDIFVILFVLLSLYFLIKRKNLFIATIFLSMATAIKYFTIILLPFIIIYYFRKEKPKKRLIKCIQYGLLFLITLTIPYLLYVRDGQVLSGLFIQQEKVAKNFYVILLQYFTAPKLSVETVNHILLGTFTIIYFFTCIILLNKKNIKLQEEMKKANYFIMAFLFLLITNFQPWYIMWLFPLIPWQKSKVMIWIPQIGLISEFANSIFLTYGEGWQNGTPFTFIFIIGILAIWIINQELIKGRKKSWKNSY